MTTPSRQRLLLAAAALMFVGSGFSALALQTVFNKYFSFIFGVSTYAAATVLAAFMSGLAAGAFLIGRFASTRMKRHLLWYGALEACIGLYALGFLGIAGFVEHLYTPLARDFQLSLRWLTLIRFVSAVVLVGVPATLMGGTLPVLIEGLKRRGLKSSVNLLYALNVLGAALGTLLSSYVLLPLGSLPFVLRVVFATNVGVFLATLVASRLGPASHEAPAAVLPQGHADVGRRLLFLALFSGFVTFSNEVYWYHLLGLVVGTSVYAYAIMLFTTLLGMSLSGIWAQRYLSHGGDPVRMLLISQLGLALATLAGLPLWDRIPELFTRLEFVAESFLAREVVRFLASCLLILPAAIAAGLTFPVLLFEVERRSHNVGASVGRLTAVNTLGTVLGSLLSGFVVLDLLGGRRSLLFSALLSVLVVAVLPGLRPQPGRRGRVYGVLAAGLGVWLGAVLLLPDWDAKRLLSGSNIYFGKAHDDFDEVVWQHEDYVGGVTSVIRTGKTLTMLTNGKFQGNDGSEVKDQRRFALIPNLFVARPERALNIGLGTATTLAVIGRFPYQEIDAVELAPDIVYAARRFFGSVNDGILDRKDVRVHLEDGRNFLALNRRDRPYDLISIELTSVWFAGAGNLYSDEFYALARENLREEGVLQQWIQMHHVSKEDLAVIIGTLRKHFRHVQLWLPGHQGILVASNRPLQVVPERLAEVGRLFPPGDFFAGDHRTVLGELLLTAEQVDAFLAEANRERVLPLSTDQNLYLEFSTPRGNVLGWNYDENLAALAKHSRPDWPGLLGGLAQNTPSLVWYGTVGRASFAHTHSTAWHLQVDQGLAMIPDAQERSQVKQALLTALSAAPR